MLKIESHHDIPYILYIPEAFESLSELPLVVFFRGAPEEWFKTDQDFSRGGRNFASVAADLIRLGYLKPAAFLFPDTTDQDVGEFFFAEDVFESQLRRGRRAYLTQAVFERELLPHLASEYKLDIGRVSLDGFSLGGYTSLCYSMLAPERYVSTGSFDGSLLDYDFDNRRITPDTPSDVTFDLFPYNFGRDPDEVFFRSRNPLDRIVTDAVPANLFVMATTYDVPQANFPRVREFCKLMDARSVVNHAPQMLIADHAKHFWFWVDEYLYLCLPFHTHKLAEAKAP